MAMNKWYKIQYVGGFVEWMDEITFCYQAGLGNLALAKVLEITTTKPLTI
jgi:hypothetical protein